ncbi:MAG: serine/threonine protein kinase [Deltaproteobacteria bacterium]|nr:serine/threonine protein kinase [Deltaproteobacteria bacterium]
MEGQELNDPLIGTTVGNYEVRELLGEGAMGQVYLGEHPQIGRKVAIKVLIASFSANPEMADRFLSEAKAVNRISHRNIIQVFDFGQLPDGRLYLTMEYLEGVDLSVYMMNQGEMSIADTLDLLNQMASALDAAHEVGIIHRDLKPDNIFITVDSGVIQAKILDFGVAKLMEPDMGAKHKTATGLIMGTPSYMCPEQAAGSIHLIGPASDIYSLAIIIYQMLSGQLPIDGDIVPKVLMKHISEPPVPIMDYLPGFPQELWSVIGKALEKKPEDRYKTAGEFSEDFSKVCEALPVNMKAIPFTRIDAHGLDATLAGIKSPMGVASQDKKSSHKGLIISLGLIITVVIVFSLWKTLLSGNGNEASGKSSTQQEQVINKISKSTEGNKKSDKDLVLQGKTSDSTKINTVSEEKEINTVFHIKITSVKPTLVEITEKFKEPYFKKTPFNLNAEKGSLIKLVPQGKLFKGQEKIINVSENLDVKFVPRKVSSGRKYSSGMRGSMKKKIRTMVGEDTLKVMF